MRYSTYFITLTLCLVILSGCSRQKPKVCIQPFNGVSMLHVREVKQALEQYYKMDIDVLEPIELPQQAYYEPRNRYRADSLIRFLAAMMPGKYDKILGLTSSDISITKGPNADYGIFGLGFRPGKSCIVSTHRLNHKAHSNDQFLARLRKIAQHELGHTMGLKHCEDPACFMRSAKESLKSIDEANEWLCMACKSKISHVLVD